MSQKSSDPQAVSFASQALKRDTGTWVHPMHPRTRDTHHRLIRLWIIGDRWIMGPALHLLAGVGAAVDESGHDLRWRVFA
jgi:hypothetical protein